MVAQHHPIWQANQKRKRTGRLRQRTAFEALEPRTLLTTLTISGSFGTGANYDLYTLDLSTDDSTLASSGAIAIDWGDSSGTLVEGTGDPVTHTYSDFATHTIKAYAADSLTIPSGSTYNVDSSANKVVLLNNLTIESDGTLNLNGHDIVVGGSGTIGYSSLSQGSLDAAVLAGIGLTTSGETNTDPDVPKIEDTSSDGDTRLIPIDLSNYPDVLAEVGDSSGQQADISTGHWYLIDDVLKANPSLTGVVNFADYAILEQTSTGTPGYADITASFLRGDLDFNGTVESADTAMVDATFGDSDPVAAPPRLVSDAFSVDDPQIPPLATSTGRDVSVTPPMSLNFEAGLPEQKSFDDIPLAGFSDSDSLGAAGYIAAVDWGDGNAVSFGQVVPDVSSLGDLDLEASHHFSDAGDYTIHILLRRASDNAPLAEGATTVTIQEPPDTTTNLIAGAVLQSGQPGASLRWSAMPAATSYDIYRSTTPGGEGATPYAADVTGTNFIDGDLSGGTYYYEVMGVGGTLTDTRSLEVAVTIAAAADAPSPPSNFSATFLSGTINVQFTWTNPADTTDIHVQQSLNGVNGWTDLPIDASDPGYTVTGTAAQLTLDGVVQKYFYRVKVKTTVWSDYGEAIAPFYDPQDGVVQLSAAADDSSDNVTLSWIPDIRASYYYVYRRELGSTSWGTPAASLDGSATTWTDDSASANTAYEYRVDRFDDMDTPIGTGQVASAVELNAVESRGTIDLLIDDRLAAPLTAQIGKLASDLEGDGWNVIEHVIDCSGTSLGDTTNTVDDVKSLIVYDHEHSDAQSVFILGDIAIPHIILSTTAFGDDRGPDGHGTHTTWPADAYYGDMNGTWTLDSPSVPGVFAEDIVPGNEILSVGRVDMFNLPDFQQVGESDAQEAIRLTAQYLEKDHLYRQGLEAVSRTGEIGVEWGNYAAATGGWSNFTALVGASGTQTFDTQDWFSSSVLGGSPILWAYAAGGGNPNGFNSGQLTSSLLKNLDNRSNAIFNMLFGSWFGEWDLSDSIDGSHQDDLMQALLANSGASLTVAWGQESAGGPSWLYDGMGIGETIGDALASTDDSLFQASLPDSYLALLGDPTLRMDVVQPASSLIARDGSSGVELSWTASADAGETGFTGYYVYRQDSSGNFVRISGDDPITSTSFTDTSSTWGTSQYMVRVVLLEGANPSEYHSGTYYNLSEGAFVSAYQYTPSTSSISISQSGSNVNIVDGTSSSTISVANVPALIIASGTNNQAITLNQSSANVSVQIICSGTGDIALNVSGGSMTFATDAGASTPHLTIEASDDATVTFTGSQALEGLIVDTGASVTLDADAHVGAVTGSGPLTIESGSTLTTSGDLSVGSVIDNGTIAFDSSDKIDGTSAISGSGGVSQLGTGTTTLNQYAANGPLNLAGGTLVLALDNGPVKTSNLIIATNTDGTPMATLDLTNNSLLIQGASASLGTWDGSSYSGILGLLAAGAGTAPLSGGIPAWSGVGITSSAAASNSSMTLAATDGATYKTFLGNDSNHDTFAGDAVANTDVIIKYTLNGDANLDGVVDGLDYAQIDAGFNNSTTFPMDEWSTTGFAMNFANGDFNYDGVIDFWDYAMIDSSFGG